MTDVNNTASSENRSNIDQINRITDLEAKIRRLEAENAEYRARLAQLDDLWDTWLRTVSHDLRTPLTLILGYTQTMLIRLRSNPDAEQSRHDLEATANAAYRLEKMVSEVVDAARLETGQLPVNLQGIDPVALVRDQVRRANRRYPEASIRTSIPDNVPLITGDVLRASQIIAALLSNAVVFSPPKAPILVSIRGRGDFLDVAITDQGAGLTAEDLARLFNRAYRPERLREARREGLGLSLMIAKQVAFLMGASLTAESPGPNEGSTFHLQFPIASDTPD
ncbi:MAG: ATP-binding protein [Chloroflexi bacterium]|nr:ATP-binding protein [Chloroflexota bacterium]